MLARYLVVRMCSAAMVMFAGAAMAASVSAAAVDPPLMRALAAAGADPTLTTTERWRGVVERAGGVGPARVVGGFVTPVMAAVRGSSDRGRFFLYTDDPVAEERAARARGGHGRG